MYKAFKKMIWGKVYEIKLCEIKQMLNIIYGVI